MKQSFTFLIILMLSVVCTRAQQQNTLPDSYEKGHSQITFRQDAEHSPSNIYSGEEDKNSTMHDRLAEKQMREEYEKRREKLLQKSAKTEETDSCSVDDSLALVAIYNKMNGENWTNQDNWLTDAPVKDWWGITVENHRVTELNFYIHYDSTQNVEGTFADELWDLTGLEVLYLSSNKIEDEIPAAVGNLDNLQNLDLNSNELTGEIPSEIGNLGNLHYLYLENNELTGEIPIETGNLSNLQFLSLNINALTGEIPSEIGELDNLHSLWLNNNQFESLPDLTGLENLSNFYLYDNYFTFGDLETAGIDPAEIDYSYDPQKKILSVEADTSSGQVTLSVLAESPNNSYQWFENGDTLHGETDSTLTYDENSSNNYYCKITNDGFPDLTLQTKGVGEGLHNGVLEKDYEALVEFYQQTGGDDWDNTENWFTDTIVQEWHGVTVNGIRVSELSLYDNNLKGTLPDALYQFDSLEYFNFYNNSLTGEIPSEIGNLENLSSFSLSQNELSGAIPPELGSLANLESLYLYNNQFDELPDMSSLTNLYYCYINDNYFTFNDLKTAGLNPDDIPVYTYAPQEQLSKPDTSNIGGNEVELTVDDEATNNEYIWLKDGEPFDTTTTNNVTITLDETAEYFCKIKNPDFPDLTLETEKFVMGTDNYTVTFQVTNGGDPVEGAEITINASNLVTDAQGEATIDLPNETYDYTVTKSGYDDETGTLTVDGSDVTEEVVLTETRYTVTFSVKDEEDTPVESAIIDIDGETLTTDANGEAALDTVNGDYDYTITKTGYGDETGTLTVDGSAVTEEVVLTEMYTVTFSVTDEEDTPVESATIDIDGETLTTDDNGEATLDTVNGEYDYTVTAEGYEDAEGNVEIDGDDLTEEVSLTAVSTSIENPEGVNVTVYPIPASESVVVESNSVIESIRMFNLEGVVLKTLEPSSNQVSIDIREYATGYYMLHIKDDNGRMTTKQIIIE